MQRRERKRGKLVKKFRAKRIGLKAIIADPNASYEEKLKATQALEKIRDASSVRKNRRCPLTGRKHGFYRTVGLARGAFRRQAMEGNITGLTKSSW